MDSVAPEDDKTPITKLSALAGQLARLQHEIGVGREDGMRGEVRQISAAQIDMYSIVLRIDQQLVLAEANRINDLVTAQVQREEDQEAARDRDANLAGKIDSLRMGVAVSIGAWVTLAVALAIALFARGCL